MDADLIRKKKLNPAQCPELWRGTNNTGCNPVNPRFVISNCTSPGAPVLGNQLYIIIIS